jgi:hypothetical protein
MENPFSLYSSSISLKGFQQSNLLKKIILPLYEEGGLVEEIRNGKGRLKRL